MNISLRTILKQVISNKTGSAITMSVVMASAIAGMAYMFTRSAQHTNKMVKSGISKEEVSIGVERYKILATEMVANNIIICREAEITTNADDHCNINSGITPAELENEYLLIKDSNNTKNSLILRTVDGFITMTISLLDIDNAEARKWVKVVTDTRADRDNKMIFINIKGEDYDTKNNIKTFVQENLGIRRPMAALKIAVDPISCLGSCITGSAGFCISAQIPPNDAQTTVTVTNLGPGVIYHLELERMVQFKNDPATYSNRTIIDGESGNLLNPGMDVSFNDRIPCPPPITAIGGTIDTTLQNNDGGKFSYSTTMNPKIAFVKKAIEPLRMIQNRESSSSAPIPQVVVMIADSGDDGDDGDGN